MPVEDADDKPGPRVVDDQERRNQPKTKRSPGCHIRPHVAEILSRCDQATAVQDGVARVLGAGSAELPR